MNHNRFATATVVAILLIAPTAIVGQPPCSAIGSWITGFADPSGSGLETDTLVPLDPSGNRLAYRGSITNPSLWSPFAPDAAVLSTMVGTFVRIRPAVYRFTIVMHAAEALPKGTPGRARITTLAVFSGMAECTGQHTLVQKGTFAVFSAIDVSAMGIRNQDKDHDGFPDAGEAPIVSLPVEVVSKRVQIQEPYPVTP